MLRPTSEAATCLELRFVLRSEPAETCFTRAFMLPPGVGPCELDAFFSRTLVKYPEARRRGARKRNVGEMSFQLASC